MNLKKFGLFTFLVSFCSVSYQVLIASKITQLTGGGLIFYPMVMGLFILGMGLGSLYPLVKSLSKLEILLAISGFCSIIFIDVLDSHFFYPWTFLGIVGGLGISFWIGYLSGSELPLIFNYLERHGVEQKVFRRIILLDYMGSLFASLAFVLLLFPYLGIFKTSVIVSLLNLGAYLLISGSRTKVIISLILTSKILGSMDYAQHQLSSLKFAFDKSSRLVRLFNTSYQEVVTVVSRKDRLEITPMESEDYIIKNKDKYILHTYLNYNLQFYNDLAKDLDPYHTYLIDPFVKAFDIKKVLILGGGDGLPARQVIKYPTIEQIDMVDLDGDWVEYSKNDPLMRLNNNNALSDPRLTLYISDAFKFVARAKDKYDLIIIDFPESDNLAGLRVHSIQFDRDLYRILSDNGMVVVQNDSTPYPKAAPLILESFKKSGFEVIYGEKPASNLVNDTVSQFVAFKSSKDKFKYFSFLKEYKYSKIAGQVGMIDYKNVVGDGQWVSFYDPKLLNVRLKYYWDMGWSDE